jgi:phage repressor protein C with HTH and peptisase S24 domain
MSVADRLKQAREAAGFENAVDAVRRFGWTQSTYLGHENGSRGVTAGAAARYGLAFKVPPEWILFGGDLDERDLALLVTTTEPAADMVDVYNVEASAGFGSLVGNEMVVDRLSFPPGYLSKITRSNPKNLAIIGVKGKSMEPTLSDDDIVMVDLSKTDLSYDGLFVVRDGGDSLLVKRISRGSRRGTVMLVSDNPQYPNQERSFEDVEVVGKVIWKGVKE